MPEKKEFYGTVKDLIATLSDLTEEQKNYRITCCGIDGFWLHIFEKEKAVTIDMEEYID